MKRTDFQTLERIPIASSYGTTAAPSAMALKTNPTVAGLCALEPGSLPKRPAMFPDVNGQFGEMHVQLMNIKPGCVLSLNYIYIYKSNEYMHKVGKWESPYSSASTWLLGYISYYHLPLNIHKHMFFEIGRVSY